MKTAALGAFGPVAVAGLDCKALLFCGELDFAEGRVADGDV